MNERIEKLAEQAGMTVDKYGLARDAENGLEDGVDIYKFAELIVKEMCGLMEQAEDDAYHCFEPSERPTEYIEWLRDWQQLVAKHFGVEE